MDDCFNSQIQPCIDCKNRILLVIAKPYYERGMVVGGALAGAFANLVAGGGVAGLVADGVCSYMVTCGWG